MFRGSDRLLGPTVSFSMGTGGGGISTKTKGRDLKLTTHLHCRDYELVDIYVSLGHVGNTTLFRTKHVENRVHLYTSQLDLYLYLDDLIDS